jgi:pimeloyl-ACP methyl ester carboxylesterase
MGQYSMTLFGEQMIALLDHLQVDEAVLAGTSLGRQHDARSGRAGPGPRARAW